MRDLTGLLNDELARAVFHEEYFFIERNNREFLLALVDEEFIYTAEQLEFLVDWLDSQARHEVDHPMHWSLNK
jgi:hypothetical protein